MVGRRGRERRGKDLEGGNRAKVGRRAGGVAELL